MPRLPPFRPFAIAAIFVLPLALGGCVGAVVLGGLAAAGGTGYAAAQERGLPGTADDFKIKNDIQAAWAGTLPPLQAEPTVTVYEGRVLLTGTAASPQSRAQAQQLASAVPGVRAVYDNIQVAPPEPGWSLAKDAWITTRLRTDLAFASHIRSLNYSIETTDQSVYLIGTARTPAELDRATQIARYLPGVRRVVSYVEIRPGAPVADAAAQPRPMPAPVEMMPPDSGTATPLTPGAGAPQPQAPIEVQKL
jgi:osmotically-inducible protein OsmY